MYLRQGLEVDTSERVNWYSKSSKIFKEQFQNIFSYVILSFNLWNLV